MPRISYPYGTIADIFVISLVRKNRYDPLSVAVIRDTGRIGVIEKGLTMISRNLRGALLKSTAFGLGSTLVLLSAPALANPLSGAVTTGSASVVSSSNKTTIDQK